MTDKSIRTLGDKLGGGGGLSLRRVSRIKQVLNFQSRQDDGDPEDRWFVGRIGTLPGARMPPPEVEKRFSVQGVWHEKPMGYHVGANGENLHRGVWDNEEQRKKIYEYCPEIKMVLNMKFEREKCTEEEVKAKQEADHKKEEEIKKKIEEQRKKQEEKEKQKDEKEDKTKDKKEDKKEDKEDKKDDEAVEEKREGER